MCVLFCNLYTLGVYCQSPVLSSKNQFFIPKIFYTFGQCVITETLYNPGVFYISRKSALATRRGMCSTLTYHSIFNLPTTSLNYQKSYPKYPIFVRELLRRTFEKSFISNNFQLPKNPQSHRITLKSHPKITKPQIKSTHSRTKSNNPIPTTKIHTTPPSHHTSNQHKNKAKPHIKALTQYTKTSLL